MQSDVSHAARMTALGAAVFGFLTYAALLAAATMYASTSLPEIRSLLDNPDST
jgi:hypothetical protein